MKRREISTAALPAIGQMLAGGFYAGRIFFDGAEHALILADRDYECETAWWDQTGPRPRIHGATSRFDGLANTKAMAEEGSAIARKVLEMNIRGTWGWHIAAIEELLVIRANLLQLADWNHRISQNAPQAFAFHQYWSSTQKDNAPTAWLMPMHPWSVADTNWVSKIAGFRPVKVLKIKAETFIHEAATDIATTPAVSGFSDLKWNNPELVEVLERFVNEDTGRFYGRTEELLAELAKLGAEQRP